MPSPSLLDFNALTAPIAGDDPAGRAVPFASREKFEEARKEIDPSSFAPNDPRRPPEPKRADWPLIIRLTQETLLQNSKDLLTAARLTEALTRAHGFGGLRDGLRLLRLMIETCWDRLYPPIEEEGDIEVRAAAFFWLDDPDRGARFPASVHAIPFVEDAKTKFTWERWRQAQKANQAFAGFEEAIQATPREVCQNMVDDLNEAVADLGALWQMLQERMKQHAPGLGALREAVLDCQTLAQQILAKKPPAPVAAQPEPEVPEEAAPAGSPGEAAPAARPARAVITRDDIYQQIANSAAALKKLEPHSPIPFLLEYACQLGALTFPELMKVLVRNPDVLRVMNRELGIKDENAEE